MSAGFTPGPWKRDEYRRIAAYTNGNPGIVIRKEIAQVDALGGPWPKSESWHEREANAHLIAAAPELYDALDLFVHEYAELVNSGDAGFWNPEEEHKVIKARAALAKARGEA